MKSLLFVLFLTAIAANVYGQKDLTRQPPIKGSAPLTRTPPTFPDSATNQEAKSVTVDDLPSLKQEKVFHDLNSAFTSVERQLITPELAVRFRSAKDEFDKLKEKGASLPKLVLWSLNEDAKLIGKYKRVRAEEYAFAAFEHIQNVARAESSAEEAVVTVVTVNSRGKRHDGFEVCYTASEWSDLADPPMLTFGYPSKSTENLPKANWTFWSRDFKDHTKVGHKSAKRIDKDQTVSIGSPQ